jgi:hypothetical protein
MAVGARVTLQPIPINLGALTAGPGWITATTPGYDLGSPSAITAWGGALGVMIPNPGGNVILSYAVGGTAAGVCQVLVGDLVGTTGQVLPATTYGPTLTANSSGWLGPFSPATFNQQAPTLVTYAGAINTQALVAGAQGCVVIDFTTTTTLAVRALSLIPVQP